MKRRRKADADSPLRRHTQMLPGKPPWISRVCLVSIFAVFLAVTAGSALADQVQMQNGDRYVGTVTSLTSDTLVLHSEVLGTVRLPRAKVAAVLFGSNPNTNALAAPVPTNGQALAAPSASTNLVAHQLSSGLRELAAHTNLLRQVQQQFLGAAGPEANAKFNELITGLSTGKLSLNDLRAQAQAAADQVRSARKDLGEDAGGMLDTYLAILDSFLKETGGVAAAATNAPAP